MTLSREDMTQAISKAQGLPPIARALANAALRQASDSQLAAVNAAVESIANGEPIEEAIGKMGLSPDAVKLAIGLFKSNPALVAALRGNGNKPQRQ